ncbi:hypothetical protein [Gottfriedia acidiceleris]
MNNTIATIADVGLAYLIIWYMEVTIWW